MPRAPLGQVGALRAEVDYAANNGRANAVVIVNESGVTCRVLLHLTNNRTYGGDVPPGETAHNLPGNALKITVAADGEVTGDTAVRYEIWCPSGGS